MSSDWDALLRAILENPEDDTVRLVAADWLDEHDRPERAEFIRVQIEIEQRTCKKRHHRSDELSRGFFSADDAQQYDFLSTRERELLESCPKKKRNGHWVNDPPTNFTRWVVGRVVGLPVYKRGFVDSLKSTWESWRDHAEVILKAHPVRKVTLTTMPPLEWLGGYSGPEDARIVGLPGTLELPLHTPARDIITALLTKNYEGKGIEFELPPDRLVLTERRRNFVLTPPVLLPGEP